MNRFLIRYGSLLFMAYMAGGAVGLLRFDTPFNAPFHWAWRYLALPLTLLIVGYTVFNWRELVSLTRSRSKVCLCTVMLVPVAVLMSGGWAALVNGSFPKSRTIIYEGPIRSKFETHGRYHGYHVELLDRATRAPVRLNVSQQVYGSLGEGDHYSRTMQEGALGIPFQVRGKTKGRTLASPALENWLACVARLRLTPPPRLPCSGRCGGW